MGFQKTGKRGKAGTVAAKGVPQKSRGEAGEREGKILLLHPIDGRLSYKKKKNRLPGRSLSFEKSAVSQRDRAGQTRGFKKISRKGDCAASSPDNKTSIPNLKTREAIMGCMKGEGAFVMRGGGGGNGGERIVPPIWRALGARKLERSTE